MGNSRKQSPTIKSQSTKKRQFSSTSTSSKHSTLHHQYYNPRNSYHFTRINTSSPNNQNVLNITNFHEQPGKSTKHRAKRRASRTSSPLQLRFHHPQQFGTDRVLLPTNYSSSNNKINDDIIRYVDNNSTARKDDKLEGRYVDSFSMLVLPPIVTKTSTKFIDFLSDDAMNNNIKKTKPRSRMVTNKDQQQNVEGESRFTLVDYMNRWMGDFRSELMTSDPSNGSCLFTSSNEVNVHKYDRSKFESLNGSLKIKIRKENNASMKEVKSSPSGSRRLRLKVNSPRIRSWKNVSRVAATTGGRSSLSDRFAIVKSSFNPLRDFRESMVEMIVHNNLKNSKNSNEYHDLIIKAFKQIWFDLSDN